MNQNLLWHILYDSEILITLREIRALRTQSTELADEKLQRLITHLRKLFPGATFAEIDKAIQFA